MNKTVHLSCMLDDRRSFTTIIYFVWIRQISTVYTLLNRPRFRGHPLVELTWRCTRCLIETPTRTRPAKQEVTLDINQYRLQRKPHLYNLKKSGHVGSNRNNFGRNPDGRNDARTRWFQYTANSLSCSKINVLHNMYLLNRLSPCTLFSKTIIVDVKKYKM